jgi:hypothetical protein
MFTDGVNYPMIGQISNFRVTNTAVYDPTVAWLTIPTSPLTAITGTQLLTFQNATIVDNSTNALTLTNNGSVTTQLANPFGVQLSTPAVDYLVVAGGGGSSQGGGGAGGLLQGSIPVTTGSALTVTVGGGGAAYTQGQNSVFSSIAAIGGGAAASGTGGSGGGGNNAAGQQGTFSQGNTGGAGSATASPYAGGGGGGAGTVGLNATSTVAGNGGAGIASAISGTITTYAGGGGGGGPTNGTGGVGGGGAGDATGTANTGGGGGGGYGGGPKAGGSGIVIISYPDIYAGAASTTGSPTVSTSGSGSLTGNSLTASTSWFNYAGQSAFSFGTGDFTIEFWAYFTNTSVPANYLIDFRGSSAPTGSVFGIYQNSAGFYYFSSSVGEYSFMGVPAQNRWYSVAVTRVSNTVRLFINGELKSTFVDTYSYSVGNTGPSIMGSTYYNNYGFNGYISNYRIIKGTGLYTASYTPSTVPLTVVSGTSLLLNTVSGAYLTDSSVNAHTPSVTNTMAWNQTSPFATGLGYKNRVYTWTSSGSITF